MKCEAKERTLYRDKAQLFQKMRDIFQGGGPLNDFTYYDPEVDLATYDCDAPMLLPPGGGSYTFAQTNMTDIMKIEIETIPSGWSVPVIKYPVTSLQVVIPDKVVSDEYELTLRVWIYDYTGVFLEVQRIDMYIEVGAYTTDCSIEVLDADTGEPISGALVEGEMGYLEGENKRGFTDTDGIAYFIDMDNYYNHTRDIVIEATGYEPLQVSVSTWLDEEHIYRSYSLKPRSKTGRLTVLVSDVFGDVGGADVYISNGRLVDDHYETYPDGGDAVTDRINPGTYHVVISKQGYQTAEFDVEMLEDGSDKRVKQQLIHDRTATLILHINDSSGNGISGAVADINHTIFEAGNDGTLVLEYIPLGEHMLAVRAEGYITREKRIYFREETEMSICLKETKTAPLMREYDYNHAAISAGYGHTVYIGKDNRAYGTGSNEYYG